MKERNRILYNKTNSRISNYKEDEKENIPIIYNYLIILNKNLDNIKIFIYWII